MLPSQELEAISVMGVQTGRAGVYISCYDLRKFSKRQCCSIIFYEKVQWKFLSGADQA